MGKYTRINSTYILRKKHKTLSGSQILERDWPTIGGLNRFTPGKRPFYRDGNFVFTTNSVPSYQKRHVYGKWAGEWTYDDVKDVSSDVNDVNVNQSSDDLRDFAYYGSCVEMVRASIESIISNFPAQITVTSDNISVDPNTEYWYPNGGSSKTTGDEFEYITGYYKLYNPFNIDLYHSQIQYSDEVNMMRYLDYSYSDYTVSTTGSDGSFSPITSYSICWEGNGNCKALSVDEYYCSYQYNVIVTITVNNSIKIYGYQIGDEIVFVTSNQSLVIRPSDDIIDKYFNSLEGFERQLLIRSTTPLYKNTFLTPIENSKGVTYVYRDYTWPSDGYQILIDSGSYTTFVKGLVDMSSYWDETYCDNLYRAMTHEAIKNYDWTYTREYAEGDEEKYVDGGDRMANTLRVIGAYFDDIKRYIDGIKYSSEASYDGFNNLPNSLLSDKLELNGIEPYSIIPIIDNKVMNDVTLTESFLGKYVGSGTNWYGAFGLEEMNMPNMDNEFMRRMMLNCRHILSSKGTSHAIDMIFAVFGFGEDDYTITEEYRTTTAKPYDDYSSTYYGINQAKNLVRQYDDEDEYSGVPLKTVHIGNNKYIVPFVDMSKDYDGYLYFQSKGGWGFNNDDEDGIEYMETQSYLGVAQTVSDLLEINPNRLKNYDIYYVNDISDILEYDEDVSLSDMSHMFYVTDEENTQSFSGWLNINSISDSTEKAYVQKKAEYLESIISVNVSNNPHVGFGNYDLGETYFEYLKQPFKYAIDNNFLSSTYAIEAEDDSNLYEITKLSGDKIMVVDKNSDTYYLNSKVVTIKNNLSNDLYKQYFKDVILKYLIQVIPSTTILVLDNFGTD